LAGFELPDADDDVDDDHDSNYNPDNDTQSSDDSTASSDSLTHTSDDDDDDGDDNNNKTSAPCLIAGVDSDDEDTDDDEDEEDDNDGDSDPQEPEADITTEYKNGDDTTEDDEEVDNDAELGTINIPDETTGPPSAHSNAGVGNSTSDKDDIDVENAGVGGDDEETKGERDRARREMDARYGPRQHSINLREQKPQSYDHMFNYEHALLTYEKPMGELFLMEQMSLKKGMKQFGKTGAEVVVAELRQLDYRNVIKPVSGKELTPEQQCRALNYLMYLKQKRCG
jgi:hypothetical protein